MTESDEWPFDQARNVAAISDASVVNGSPILFVVHYSEDDSWAFLSGAAFDVAPGAALGDEGSFLGSSATAYVHSRAPFCQA